MKPLLQPTCSPKQLSFCEVPGWGLHAEEANTLAAQLFYALDFARLYRQERYGKMMSKIVNFQAFLKISLETSLVLEFGALPG